VNGFLLKKYRSVAAEKLLIDNWR